MSDELKRENVDTPLPENEPEDPCLEIINDVTADEPGIVGINLDTNQQRLTFDYNPNLISEPQLEAIAEQVKPSLQQNWQTCTMRLGQRGGRLCESCALALEQKLRQLPNIRQAEASYTGGVLSITYDHAAVSPDRLMQNIRQLGVDVAPSRAELPLAEAKEAQLSGWQQRWRWFSQNLEAVFTLITLLAMAAGWLAEYFGAPLPVSLSAYLIAYITGGTFGLKAGLESLRERKIDIDLLMILAALGAAVVGAPFEGAMLLFLFSLSNVLQDYALDRTRNAIRALMKLRPDQALVKRNGQLVTLPIDQVGLNDHFMVRPGDRIPLDGVVVNGESAVDQSSITGESMPVPKQKGDTVLAGTINKNGSLEARVTKLAKDSTIAKMIKLVEEAQSRKAPTQRFLDQAEQYYATGVIGFTLLAIAIPTLVLGEAFNTAFYRAMTLMVAASPCALVISTPASILSAIGNGARKGILFKGGVYMEQAAGIKVVAFDKTGTLTEGKPRVTDVKVLVDALGEAAEAKNLWRGSQDDLLALAAAVEGKSEHALGRATVEAAKNRDLEISEALAFEAATGKGARGNVDGRDIRIGNLRYFEELKAVGLGVAQKEIDRLQTEGKTAVTIAQIENGVAYIVGVIAFADRVRANAADVVRQLKAIGVERVVMLTGDNRRVAQAIADQVGINHFYADLLPEDKVNITRKLETEVGAVAMVGDGVNDAPALAAASIGIAMGAAGTDVALETADVVLLSDDLNNIPYVIELSRQTRKTLITNLGFAMAAILVMVVAIFTVNFPLPLAVIGHEGGTVLVSLNGLRLLVYKHKRPAAGAKTSSSRQYQPV